MAAPYDPTLDVTPTRGRLNSVHALLEETNLAMGDAHVDDAFWTKLQAHILDESDAGLRATLVGRQALAACSPLCASTAQVGFVCSIADSFEGPNRLVVLSAVFRAQRLFLAVKPGLLATHFEVDGFLTNLRQSKNLFDDRQWREELMVLIIKYLIEHGRLVDAAAICAEFLEEDGAGIQAIAIDGLLDLASRKQQLPISLIQAAWNLMLHAPTKDGRVDGVRLFRTVTLQHGRPQMERLLHGLSLAAADRAECVRIEAALSFRFVSVDSVPQLLAKAQLDEHNMEGQRWQLVCNGVLLSLLEDVSQEVRCEASRSVVHVCKASSSLPQEALEHAISAHADASHEDSARSTQLQFLLALDALLGVYHARFGRFTVSTEQLSFLLRHALRAPHAQGAVVLLSALTKLALETPYHASSVVAFLSSSVTPLYTSAPRYVQAQLEAHARTIGAQIAALWTHRGDVPASPLLLALATPSPRSAPSLLVCTETVPLRPRHPLACLHQAPTSVAHATDLLQQAAAIEMPSEFVMSRYKSVVLGLLDGVLELRTGGAHWQRLLETAVTYLAVMSPSHLERTSVLDLLALVRCHFATSLEDARAMMVEWPRLRELPATSLDELRTATMEQLHAWWPVTWFESEPHWTRHVHATVEWSTPHEPLTTVAGWPCDVPLAITAFNVTDPHSLVLKLSLPHQEPLLLELTPRDFKWTHASLWRASIHACCVPMAVTGLVHLEVVLCMRTRRVAHIESFLQPISPLLRLPLAVSRPAPRPPMLAAQAPYPSAYGPP
ncbi:hypothetical protein SPRG_02672 [Saprolegnia parasitica CBS 223.65]|uniref:Uncharacterized protein n=1 Tax=Saprolegnia parasitica (strain CBS 223.65) TaxID=695850 RepID=A0A067D2I4_SAPPC|nr:hypothetical protein SPRG_02672 [Saprolegnia parasitica CBS 223.65]KDO32981.1 hypothetical protein SPRG_02672 [Saprolegnia parasitica CBS 223.65]|eukprot:XP_012196626.1 hypothetical protein SPRG_02672 [Saprolegnia parasitica CBS 223.65]